MINVQQSNSLHEDTNSDTDTKSVQRDFSLCCHPLTPQAVSFLLIRNLCCSKATFTLKKTKTKNNRTDLISSFWEPCLFIMCSQKKCFQCFQTIFVSSLFVTIMRLRVQALTSSLKLSAYFHLQAYLKAINGSGTV